MASHVSRADLHVHSKHSNRSAEWLLRRFDFPDSYTDPQKLYKRLLERGMDFVTITDHNTIDGCLEIAGHNGVFISEEVTTYFPEDRCKLHLLVWGITEDDHQTIQTLRENVFDLAAWLRQQSIAHAVAHPLYGLNQHLQSHHVERLLLVFEHFETINGLRDWMLSETASYVLDHISPDKIKLWADKHNFTPVGEDPWPRFRVGGSDDHGGIFPGTSYTETPPAISAENFLQAVRQGKCTPKGEGGTPLTLSHSLYNTAHQFIRARFPKSVRGATDLVEKIFSRFLEGQDPTQFSILEKVGFLSEGILSGKVFELANPGNAQLVRELSEYFSRPDLKEVLERQVAGVHQPERRAFVMATHVANELSFRFFSRFVKHASAGQYFEAVQTIGGLLPIALSLSPYIYGLHSQTASRRALGDMMQSLTQSRPPFLQNRRRAWFTDTLEDVNGVTTTIRKMTAAAAEQGLDLTVVTSISNLTLTDIPIKNFPPVGEFALPEYEIQTLSFPPILNVLEWVHRERFSEIIISTPGPMGLCALLAAKMFGLKSSGIYHTDFPQYVRILSDDSFMESMTWNFMHYFYSQLDVVYVNSDHYRKLWTDRGIPAERLAILPRGLDLQLFDPRHRSTDFWQQWGGQPGAVTLLYVGRVSKEKDLDVLAGAYELLRREHPQVQLAMVGDGPYREDLTERLPDVIFTGYLMGEKLATAYASADVFAFPSTTDTFGNVLIEAQACGLPAVVSDQGGPCELIEEGVTGFITPALDERLFAQALSKLIAQPELRERMSLSARETVRNRSWDHAAREFWEATQ
ncbi:MAG: glycosyltransferase [Verrucomicrobiales bacterium]